MLTADQIEALGNKAQKLLDPVQEYLIWEIASRISDAGSMTATAQYQVWRLQNLGKSQKEIKKQVAKLLKISEKKLEQLMEDAGEDGYTYDLKSLPTDAAIPFRESKPMQDIVSAAVDLAQEDLTNITQTMGFCSDAEGKVCLPLTEAYEQACDTAFMKVSTGAQDFQSAVREVTEGLAKHGIQYIDYESGVHTSIEAATRRSVLGGMGLMQEKISQGVHDDCGCDGWEISAHACSAPDHEPIQGKQYSDKAYQKLNDSLRRRIGTLNCGHAAHPIILGISRPQYTQQELEKLRQDNEDGVEIDGKHYTMYEATQKQRAIERAIRKKKREVLVDQATGDTDKLEIDQTRLVLLNEQYKRFSDDAGLRTQMERAYAPGFGFPETANSRKTYNSIAQKANSMYDIGTEEQNIDAYFRDLPIRKKLQSNATNTDIRIGAQRKHVIGTIEYNQYAAQFKAAEKYGPARLTITFEEVKDLVEQYKGTGIIYYNSQTGQTRELITMQSKIVGISVNDITGKEVETSVFKIHYSSKGVHIVPDYPSKKGAKGKQ